jgi:hypothetical protein
MKNRKPAWTPFKPGTPPTDPVGASIFLNSRYQVNIKRIGAFEPFGQMVELSIKRRDKEPIYDWRDMQAIKNEFLGPNATMVQVFPPEKHLMDTANQYYFTGWNSGYELPFGFKQRSVNGREVTQYENGVAIQKPFEPHQVPATFEEDQNRFDAFIQQLVEQQK